MNTPTRLEGDNYKRLDWNGKWEVDWEAATSEDEDFVFKADGGRFLLLLQIDGDATKTAEITIQSGDFWQAVLGDFVAYEETPTDDTTVVLGPFETARFADKNGDIVFNLDCENTATNATPGHYEFAVVVLP